MTKSRIAITATVAIVAALAAAASVRAESDKIAFPNGYAKGVVYKSEDRPDNKQVRELFITREAVEAVHRGAPLPSGTVITSVRYAAQLDAQGNPAKDADGRFIKTDKILGYTVKEKRAGWGAEYPEETRNGDWEYRVFRADKTANPDTKYDGCFGCHKSQERQDYLFTYDSLKAASR
jgi:cytochrome P460